MSWKPAVDVNRIVLGAQFVMVSALLLVASLVVAYERRDFSR